MLQSVGRWGALYPRGGRAKGRGLGTGMGGLLEPEAATARGPAPRSRGCDGDDANPAQEQKSGSGENRCCQGTAPRLGAASGPQD